MKIAFFDRDGTINYDYQDADWANVRDPVIIPGAINALHHVLNLGYKIIIVTNQYLIEENIITLEQYTSFTKKLIGKLDKQGISILDIFFCPHSREYNCHCRKPNPGMICQAIARYPNINLAESIIIGDSECDIELAHRLNMKSFAIGLKGDLPKCTYLNNIGDLVTVLDK